MKRTPHAIVCLGLLHLAALSAAAQDAPEPAAEPLKVEVREPSSYFSGWSGDVHLGLNGSDGNSESFNLRAGAKAERKTESMESKAEVVYQRSTSSGDTTDNRLEAMLRNDWIFKDAPRWRYYLLGRYEYDDFQDWQHRASVFNGLGYAFIQDERTTLIGRVGFGVTREFGGSDNRWHPEGNLGLDLEHKIDDRQKVFLNFDFYPDFLKITDYRFVAKGGYEVLVDPESKMSLRLGFEDRYDSTPGAGSKRNDLDYFAMLVFSF